MAYRWVVGAKRYRDMETGRFLPREKALDMVDQSLRLGRPPVRVLAELVAGGNISPADWLDKMRREIRDEYIRQYLSAKGGVAMMTQADWGSIGGMLTEQFRYLDGFYADVLSGKMSEGQIAARAKMYINSAREANERAHSRGQGIPEGSIPFFPGSGKTRCLTNCACRLEIEATKDGWNIYWRLGASEHCEDCVALSAEWNPLFVPNTARGRAMMRSIAPDLTWRHSGSCNCGYCVEEKRSGVERME